MIVEEGPGITSPEEDQVHHLRQWKGEREEDIQMTVQKIEGEEEEEDIHRHLHLHQVLHQILIRVIQVLVLVQSRVTLLVHQSVKKIRGQKMEK
jgi:hypothetical protein